ncbi:Calcium-dependent protein kinase 27 [Symbiodinium microadriaticum]|uniref:Calcium-dependent protein kinase 27 n=1 Tax=Symbiodinium microadriaticum TaxID=2951 RepID=A0A1Q9DX75_SYMMI|nr:Calcium-dependent protein kinase 27 [Symbiodinium microadriaticum]
MCIRGHALRSATEPHWTQEADVDDDAAESGCASCLEKSVAVQGAGRLATFRHYSKFERAVLTLVAHRSEDTTVAELRDAFHTLDVSQSGSLSKSEIKEGIFRCGHVVEDAELTEIFSALDADGTGKVHYTEWLAATMQPSALATDKAIKQVYHYLDIDQTGHIAPHELQRVLGCSDSVQSVLKLGDTDGDSLIDESEFRVLMRNLAKRLQDRLQ